MFRYSNYSNSIPLLLSEVQSCQLGYCLLVPLWSAYFLWVICCLLPVVFAVLLHNALPFVGFGFLDNCIMIVAVSMSASSRGCGAGCGGSVGVGSLISTGGTVAWKVHHTVGEKREGERKEIFCASCCCKDLCVYSLPVDGLSSLCSPLSLLTSYTTFSDRLPLSLLLTKSLWSWKKI